MSDMWDSPSSSEASDDDVAVELDTTMHSPPRSASPAHPPLFPPSPPSPVLIFPTRPPVNPPSSTASMTPKKRLLSSLFGANLDDSQSTAFLERLFGCPLPAKMKQYRAGIDNPAVFAWLEDVLKFLSAYKEELQFPLMSSFVSNHIQEEMLDSGFMPPATLTGRVVSEIFVCLNALFKFSGANIGFETTESDRGRARANMINWEEVAKYLEAVEVRDDNEDVNMEDPAPATMVAGFTHSRRRLVLDRNTAQEQPKQEEPLPIEATVLPNKIGELIKTSESKALDMRTNAIVRFFPQVFQSYITTKYPVGVTLENFPLVPKPIESSGGYKEVVNGHVSLYTGEYIPYKELLMRRLIKYLEIHNIDAKCVLPCPYITTSRCMRLGPNLGTACTDKLHFEKLFNDVSDIAYGDCSYLNGCYNMNTCVFLHYKFKGCIKPVTFFDKIKLPDEIKMPLLESGGGDLRKALENVQTGVKTVRFNAQWINANIEDFDLRVLGTFNAVMMDPPWTIHMKVPYKQMSDDQIMKLPIGCLQDDGLIFLWVTARAHSKGLQCFKEWGYTYIDEVTWVKTNQINATVATGRTGHWLNHLKETCIIGIKGNPKFAQKIDLNMISEQIREASHKPDGIYGLIERVVGISARKLELFGRKHNLRHGWTTLGNALPGVNLVEPGLVDAYRRYMTYLKRTGAQIAPNSGRAIQMAAPPTGPRRAPQPARGPPMPNMGTNNSFLAPPVASYGPQRGQASVADLSYNMQDMSFSQQNQSWNPMPYNEYGMGGAWGLPATEPEPEGLAPAPHVGRLGGVDDTPWVQRRPQHPRNVGPRAPPPPRGGNTAGFQQTPSLRNIRSEGLGLRERTMSQLNTNPSLRNVRSLEEQGLREREFSQQNFQR